MAKFKMPAGGIGVGRGSNSNGSAAVADEPVQAGVGNPAAEETTSVDAAVAMLESDEPEGDEGGTLAAEFVSRIEENGDFGGDEYANGQAGPPDATESPTLPAQDAVDEKCQCPDCNCVEFTEEGNTIKFACGAVFDGSAGLGSYTSPCGAEQPTGEAATDETAPEVAAEQTPEQQRSTRFHDWQQRVSAAEKRLAECVIDHARLKAQTKAAKEEMEEATEALERVYGQNPDYNPESSAINTAPVVATFTPEQKQAIIEASENQQATITLPAPPNTDESWRSVLIDDLGLHPKLTERLQENGLDTIGKLEDHRAKCYDHTADWPKGIGKAKITVIEDALLDWLKENRDRAVFAELQSGQQSEQVQAGEGEADEPEGVTGADDAANYNADAEAFASEQIQARAAELTTADDLNSQYLPQIWDEGLTAFEAGKTLADCEYRPSASQDDWLRGWITASKIAAMDGGKAASPASSAPAQAKPTLPARTPDSQEVDLDDL